MQISEITSSFGNKKKILFNCLDDAEKTLLGTKLDQSATKLNFDRMNVGYPNKEIKNFRGKESIFKRPELPISKCLMPRKSPGYKVNPEKWKKYSLLDADISDKTNTAAAFTFFKEINERKSIQEETLTLDDIASYKPQFQKSNISESDVEDKPQLKGSKLIMPEYVIGKKVPKSIKRSTGSKSSQSTKAIKLSHLDDEIEEID